MLFPEGRQALFLLSPILSTLQWWRVGHEGGNDPKDTAHPLPNPQEGEKTQEEKQAHKWVKCVLGVLAKPRLDQSQH